MSNLLVLLILLPFVAGLACYFLRAGVIRSLVVTVTGGILAAASIALLAQGTFTYAPPAGWGTFIAVADFALLFVILYYAFKYRNLLIKLFTVSQIVLLGLFELFMVDHAAPVTAFYADQLSLVMVLVISIVGSLICIYGIPYMKAHEEHLHLEISRQPRFFMFMVLFLGAMNGLVLSNNILWLYFFFEVTTFCSFMLIGHDGTEVAIRNSVRALWMNSLGGLAFVIGMIWAYKVTGSLDLQQIIAAGPAASALLIPLAFICLAGFTKAAQVPFQSWLLGAMVAPTPVSALLHSSTMVKAGVYVVLRIAPAFAGSFVSDGVALCGAFTFVACAALAISQSNGKKILAYSTVSNLGLIIACAGINTPAALTAAILLIIFHAVSKSLMFLCVGTIEQEIGSRDIEDMRGLYGRMPRTTIIAVVGILTMILPPFGVLMAKWLAIESAAGNLLVVVMMALGSALTVIYWARWAGLMLSYPAGERPTPEKQDVLIRMPLTSLAVGAVVLSLGAPIIYSGLVQPLFQAPPLVSSGGILSGPMGAFAVYPLFFILGLGFLYALRAAKKARTLNPSAPYLGGLQVGDIKDSLFTGPMNAPVKVEAGNYYLTAVFGENVLTTPVNIAAIALIVLMMGGAL
ncbi:ech hydrogenase subunit A [Desulfobaculum xiamenense]|uniref:Ech hydrogenase subunit A n=1 Tax=Desulfobaculum xiamenense TaxID=995050 RepID=A0A846QIF0_9BACT|nr:NADH-quinone oxidoreductase subunit L [Desulfobaculum xiamenense]NJB68008.1 ech hydrogenase subunit A [Desulfobaculum xiamenense]